MLSNTQIRLRALSSADADLLIKWRFAEDNYAYFFECIPVSREQNLKWIEAAQSKGSEINFIAERISDFVPVGMIALVGIDARSQKCEMGRVLIGKAEDRKSGLGGGMIRLLLRYAFLHLNMRKVYCEVFADNENAIRFYKKHGFKEDGLFKEHVYKNGEFKDVLHMSIFKKDYVDDQN